MTHSKTCVNYTVGYIKQCLFLWFDSYINQTKRRDFGRFVPPSDGLCLKHVSGWLSLRTTCRGGREKERAVITHAALQMSRQPEWSAEEERRRGDCDGGEGVKRLEVGRGCSCATENQKNSHSTGSFTHCAEISKCLFFAKIWNQLIELVWTLETLVTHLWGIQAWWQHSRSSS